MIIHVFSIGKQRSYSPSSSKRRRITERSFDRGNVDYHYSSISKRGGDPHQRRLSRDRRSTSHDKYASSSSRNYTRSSPSSPQRTAAGASSNRKRRGRTPTPPRAHTSKRRSRSHSPRTYRGAPSPAYHSRSNHGESSSSSSLRRSPTAHKIDLSKLVDTSLFAEMVRDKKIRDQVLGGLKRTGPEASNSNSDTITIDSSGVIVIDSVDNPEQVSVVASAKGNVNVNLVDIPMPNAGDKVICSLADGAGGASNDSNKDEKSDMGTDNVDHSASARIELKQSPMLADEAKSAIDAAGAVTSETPAAANSNNKAIKASPVPVIKQTYTINKPKSLTNLPMPPGVNANELEDITTPSPPQSASPLSKSAAGQKMTSASGEAAPTPVRKGVLNLPMPPVIPGSEDLSGDEDYISSPNVNRKPLSTNPSNKKEVKRKRPVILNRRNSRSQAIKDWGERCVDVFEVIAQIGEGTYGQVSNQTKPNAHHTIIIIVTHTFIVRIKILYPFRCTRRVTTMPKKWLH